MKFADEKQILPEYPRTRHLPYKPNAVRDDVVASQEEAEIFFRSKQIHISEKVDGASAAMALYNGEPLIRNREHILRKGYVKDTPAKKQFASIFNWFYEHKKAFQKLNDEFGLVGVYGEWMVQAHGMEYDELPDWFIAFDLYLCEERKFLNPALSHKYLVSAGFNVVPTLDSVSSYEELEVLANQKSCFSSHEKREGLYLKISDGQFVSDRFKMVREGFVQGGLFQEDVLRKNILGRNNEGS